VGLGCAGGQLVRAWKRSARQQKYPGRCRSGEALLLDVSLAPKVRGCRFMVAISPGRGLAVHARSAVNKGRQESDKASLDSSCGKVGWLCEEGTMDRQGPIVVV
jgi:hypothetical protein